MKERADYQELQSSSSGPWRDPECSSSAPNKPVKISRNQKVLVAHIRNFESNSIEGIFEWRVGKNGPGLLSIIHADLFLPRFPTIHVSSTYEGRLAITKKMGNNRQNIHSSLCFRGTTFPFWGTQFRLENRRCDGTNGRACLDVA